MTYHVSLENFEGPLDLLLFLVRKNELDIQNIPIVSITSQYMEYVDLMQALNLDIAGEFLVMASTLMYLKSRALLPKTDDDEEQQEEDATLEALKQQLLEYQQYKDAAERLKEQNILEKDVFARALFAEPAPVDDEAALGQVSLFDLIRAFKTMLDRTDADESEYDVSREEISVKDKIVELLQRLDGQIAGIDFVSLFPDKPSRMQVITTFLAMLELIKMQAVKIYQNSNFSAIYLYPVTDDSPEEAPSPETGQTGDA
ncbi:MAG: segregation/condensation protein A [Deltaproteobacteria bacterium]|nr:segregation/condensation protein A [Deltaproteobacteria bacterium]